MALPMGAPLRSPQLVFAFLGDVTGSSRALRQLRALSAQDVPTRVLGFGAPRQPEALPPGVDLRTLAMPSAGGPRLFWEAHRALARALAEEPATVYHASDLYVLPALAAAARRHRAQLAYDAREWYAGLDAAHRRPWVGWVWGAVEGRYAPRCDLVLTVNDAIADRLAAARRIPRPTVVHNVSEHATRTPTGALRARLGLPADRPLALYQGLLRPGRGLAPLVDAMADVPEADLVLIGEGSEEASLRALAAARVPARVHFVPFTPPDDLAALTPDADLGVIVAEPLTESLRMGLPNKLFEYAAAGLPVLAGSGIEPLAEVVAQTGAGESVDPADRPALVAVLRRMLLDDAARARYRDGLARLRSRFTPDRETAAFLDAYAPLLSPDRPSGPGRTGDDGGRGRDAPRP